MGSIGNRTRVNMVVEGELSKLLDTWQERRLVSSVADAVRQGILALNERFQAMDERAQRLQAFSKED